MEVKKVFEPVINKLIAKLNEDVFGPISQLLDENPKRQVGTVTAEIMEICKLDTIMPDILELCSAKRQSGATSFIREKQADGKGKIVAILCYYYKRWMPLVGEDAVEFGVKAGSSTGLNTMTKEGASLFTKQNRIYKNAQIQMLKDIKAGELKVEDIGSTEETLETARIEIVATEKGFATKEEVLEYLEEEEIEV